MSRVYKFNSTVRENIYRVMMELDMDFISNKRQIENGTLLFEDPQTGALYGFYESGYIRRFYQTTMRWGAAQTINGIGYAMYQLNPVYTEYCVSEYNAKTYEYTRKRRQLVGPMEQLGIAVSAITQYRLKNA